MAEFQINFKENGGFRAEFGNVSKIQTTNYNDLFNKPKIEGNELIGDKTFIELGLGEITPQDIDDMFDELIYGGI